MTRAWGAWLCAIFIFLNAHPAQAALQLCNRTSYVLYAAAGWKENTENVTQGWTRVVPGDCQPVIKTPLLATQYFLYARSSQAHSGAARNWGGVTSLCVKDINFSLKTPAQAKNCTTDDAFTVPFAPVNTHAKPSWTTTLTEGPAITSTAQARDAGVTRLLNDLGYKFVDAKGREAALTKVHARFKLLPKAGDGDLFDALETEAMKTASPEGYSICNDTASTIWAVLAFRQGKETASAGWWKAPPGGCAHPLTTPIKLDKVYVHVEGPKKPGLVSGPDKFCIADVTFQTLGSGTCKSRGLKETGFAQTTTRGVTGYTAHVGADGLEPAAAHQSGTPK